MDFVDPCRGVRVNAIDMDNYYKAEIIGNLENILSVDCSKNPHSMCIIKGIFDADTPTQFDPAERILTIYGMIGWINVQLECLTGSDPNDCYPNITPRYVCYSGGNTLIDAPDDDTRSYSCRLELAEPSKS